MILIFLGTLLMMAILAKRNSHYKMHAFYIGAVLFFVTALLQGGTPLQTITAGTHNGHSSAHHIFELLLLFTGFGVITLMVNKSGLNYLIAKRFAHRPRRLNWVVFFLSAILDNILMSIIGSKISVKGRQANEKTLAALVAGANLGGAWSPFGDITTIMIAISLTARGYSAIEVLTTILPAIIAAIPAMWYLTNKLLPAKIQGVEIEEEPVNRKGLIWIAISVIGLMIGGIAFSKPGYGLWSGIVIGAIFYHKIIDFKEVLKKLFHEITGPWLMVATLISMAANLPFELIKTYTEFAGEILQIFSIGFLSAVFDNIPLTALMIQVGVTKWSLLAYSVGYGGSITWFGSSAGIAVAHEPGCESLQKMTPKTQWILFKAYFIGFISLAIALYLLF